MPARTSFNDAGYMCTLAAPSLLMSFAGAWPSRGRMCASLLRSNSFASFAMACCCGVGALPNASVPLRLRSSDVLYGGGRISLGNARGMLGN